MDTLQQGAAPMALADMPMTADGTIDFRRLAVGLVEGCVNAAMEMAVEEIAGEDAHDVLPGALVIVHSLADGPASSLGRTREPIPTGVHELTFSLNQ